MAQDQDFTIDNEQEEYLAQQNRAQKQKASKAVEMGGGNVLQKTTGNGLRWAWLSLIPSWGLSLIYINLHVFLRQIFPGFFCKLGDEWQVGVGGVQVKSKAFGIVETMALVLIDVLVLLVIMGVVVLIIWLVDKITTGGGTTSESTVRMFGG